MRAHCELPADAMIEDTRTIADGHQPAIYDDLTARMEKRRSRRGAVRSDPTNVRIPRRAGLRDRVEPLAMFASGALNLVGSLMLAHFFTDPAKLTTVTGAGSDPTK